MYNKIEMSSVKQQMSLNINLILNNCVYKSVYIKSDSKTLIQWGK